MPEVAFRYRTRKTQLWGGAQRGKKINFDSIACQNLSGLSREGIGVDPGIIRDDNGAFILFDYILNDIIGQSLGGTPRPYIGSSGSTRRP